VGLSGLSQSAARSRLVSTNPITTRNRRTNGADTWIGREPNATGCTANAIHYDGNWYLFFRQTSPIRCRRLEDRIELRWPVGGRAEAKPKPNFLIENRETARLMLGQMLSRRRRLANDIAPANASIFFLWDETQRNTNAHGKICRGDRS